MNKDELRTFWKKRRDALSSSQRLTASAGIAQNALWLAHDAKVIGIYVSIGSEVDTIECITSWLWDNKTVVVPRVKGHDLEFVKLTDFRQLKSGFFGLLEPTEGELIELDSIEVMFVPLLAYDDQLHRIGYGKGFYDRALKNFKGKKIGLCYHDAHVYTTYPHDADIKLDIIITEKEIISN